MPTAVPPRHRLLLKSPNPLQYLHQRHLPLVRAQFSLHLDGTLTHAHRFTQVALQMEAVEPFQVGHTDFDLAGFSDNGR
jgi:hypothetical protein